MSPNSMHPPKLSADLLQLAKAGFYYKPSGASIDNVVCFLCKKSLDGWENGDDPVREHVRNVPGCAWAILTDLGRCMNNPNETRAEMNPMDEKMVEARRATFQDKWLHEHRKGWKPKIEKACRAPLPPETSFAYINFLDGPSWVVLQPFARSRGLRDLLLLHALCGWLGAEG